MNGESWCSLTWRGKEVGIWKAREGSCKAGAHTHRTVLGPCVQTGLGRFTVPSLSFSICRTYSPSSTTGKVAGSEAHSRCPRGRLLPVLPHRCWSKAGK